MAHTTRRPLCSQEIDTWPYIIEIPGNDKALGIIPCYCLHNIVMKERKSMCVRPIIGNREVGVQVM